jgi:hypothetical protein
MKHLQTFESYSSEELNEKKKFKPFWLKKKGEKDEKDDKKEDKDKKSSKKGLTAKQKKLPEAMQKAILAKMK